jgi:hypothetical protein
LVIFLASFDAASTALIPPIILGDDMVIRATSNIAGKSRQ